ncbi:hypothetical protein KM427_01055 [Nocardioides sp. LMS-CY]|nr:hypothetical protein [Nocardioides sp. LMS-CY]QWF22375.1 hypothetical protein KM427_01055 [Nocardioides sp. LMS-CY]
MAVAGAVLISTRASTIIGKLICDKRAVVALFASLLVLNAFAIQHGRYGA